MVWLSANKKKRTWLGQTISATLEIWEVWEDLSMLFVSTFISLASPKFTGVCFWTRWITGWNVELSSSGRTRVTLKSPTFSKTLRMLLKFTLKSLTPSLGNSLSNTRTRWDRTNHLTIGTSNRVKTSSPLLSLGSIMFRPPEHSINGKTWSDGKDIEIS